MDGFVRTAFAPSAGAVTSISKLAAAGASGVAPVTNAKPASLEHATLPSAEPRSWVLAGLYSWACPLLVVGRQRRRRRARVTAKAGDPGQARDNVQYSRAVQVAINIGKKAETKRRGMKSQRDKIYNRTQEIKTKIDVLKGTKAKRYKKERDRKKGNEEGKQKEAGGEVGAKDDKTQKISMSGGEDRDDDYESGGEEAIWAGADMDGSGDKERKYGRGNKDVQLVSDEARAVANVELEQEGKGGAATADILMRAAEEFTEAEDLSTAAQLLEVARTRVDMDQINRRIDLKEAQEQDEESLWMLADTYATMQRLTLAAECFRELKERKREGAQGNQSTFIAKKMWGKMSFAIGSELQNQRRFTEALEVFDELREECDNLTYGTQFLEELEMYRAMTLKSLNKYEEAKEGLNTVINMTRNKKRRMQAQFILDVISVDTKGWRNEELHEIFEENFNLPRGGYSGGGSASFQPTRSVNMTPREREARTWQSQYWEDRIKSPLYYAFLVLFVTWPMAIPVVSLYNRGQLVLPSFFQ